MARVTLSITASRSCSELRSLFLRATISARRPASMRRPRQSGCVRLRVIDDGYCGFSILKKLSLICLESEKVNVYEDPSQGLLPLIFGVKTNSLLTNRPLFDPPIAD